MRAGSTNAKSRGATRAGIPGLVALAIALGLSAPAGAGPVDHISPVKPGAPPEDPTLLTKVGDTVFFAAEDSMHGRELWVSDGTAAGTRVIDIVDGSDGSNPEELAAFAGEIYFRAETPEKGAELWHSDGTPDGTGMVKDINDSGDGSDGSDPHDLTPVGGELFFAAATPDDGDELWKTDGTEGGTDIVKDIDPDTSSSSDPRELFDFNGTLIFSADDGVDGNEVWRSDGTESGTEPVADVNTSGDSFPGPFVELGGSLYFGAEDATATKALWKSDGIAAAMGGTTERVKDVSVNWPTVLGSLVLFVDDSTELWRSDGTPGGTEIVKKINPSDNSGVSQLTRIGGTVFFVAFDGFADPAHGRELWKTDGTAAGTKIVDDINPGPADAIRWSSGTSTAPSSSAPTTAAPGRELWRSDGTTAGTAMVDDLEPGVDGSDPEALVGIGAMPLFVATTSASPSQLYKATDATPPQTTLGSGPAEGSVTQQTSASFVLGTDDPPSTFACSLDGEPLGACPPAAGASPLRAPGDQQSTFGPLGDGEHVVSVRATDSWGNTDATPATRSFTVDTRLSGLEVKAKRKQVQRGRKVKVKIKVGAAEAAKVVAGGKLLAKRGKRKTSFKLKGAKTHVAAGSKKMLTLKPKGRAATKKVARMLRKGSRVKAKLRVTASDSLGNADTEKLTVRLAR